MRIPRPIVSVHAEDVDLEIPGLLTIRATFLSEGLFDERADGDPAEEDLYEVEVSHAGEALLEPIVFPRLSQATSQDLLLEDEEFGSESLPVEQFVLALAWELANADPVNWPELCEGARYWDAWTIEDARLRMPPDWTPVALFPDEE
jgi:hypothetical protein